MFLLDTNVCVVLLRNSNRVVSERFVSVPLRNLSVCSVVKAELLYGAFRGDRPSESMAVTERFLQGMKSHPFDDECALTHARLRANLSRAGKPIGPHDLLIASIALAHDLTLVTHNLKEFRRVPDLKIEDWEAV